MLVLALLIMIAILFYRRWFPTKILVGGATGSWPPIINMCPDYLVYYNNNGKPTCIDLIGISNGSSLRPWTEDDTPQNPPTDAKKYFMHVYKRGANIQELARVTSAAGLTWEGIVGSDGGANGCPTTVPDEDLPICKPPPV